MRHLDIMWRVQNTYMRIQGRWTGRRDRSPRRTSMTQVDLPPEKGNILERNSEQATTAEPADEDNRMTKAATAHDTAYDDLA